ncbi:hypothetical protein IF1G_08058 [Cordyceps javanica]|uniref:C2H2-type domain-containing protein n=1 Tax=Cordyceps javanica TaxID=43265 RepID=A0A545UVJ0_9HYPO|nr:hypothetical protein IF1G_08058 [Cordyceps javanica]TQW05179.1 hypothetical protein IF2G_07116 [Cordyceps javanica]
MSSTISSSPIDGPQELSDTVYSRNPSRQTSCHESDTPAFSPPNFVWPQPPLLPVGNYPLPHVQSLESIQTALSAPSSLISDHPSSIPYYTPFAPLAAADHADAFALCQQAGAWTAYSPDTASVDLYHDFQAGLHRTDSTLSADAARRNARASFPVDVRSKSPLKGDSDRASRSRSIVGVVTPPTDAGVKKLRKLRGTSSRRNSIPLVSSTANIRAHPDILARRNSPAKEEVVSNDDLLSSEDEDSRHRPKNVERESTFACPFYRRWPTRHIECMNRKLTRIQDVKQHIYRRHSKPPFYCPTCAKVFSSPDPRDYHIRQITCTPAAVSSKRSSDGISAQVQETLKNRLSRRLSPVEQWYSIWDLIFPGEAAPLNAHVGSIVTEMLSMLKDFWKNEGQRILPSISKPSTAQALSDTDLQLLMVQMLDKVHDHFEDEPDQTEEAAMDGMDSQTDRMMDKSPVDGESGTIADYEEVGYEPSPSSGWEKVSYSPNGSPSISIGGRFVESSADLGSSGMLVEQQQQQQYLAEQSWIEHPMAANPHVNRFQ